MRQRLQIRNVSHASAPKRIKGNGIHLIIQLILIVLSGFAQQVHAQCSLTVTAAASTCNPATNTYSTTAVVRLTNTVSGVVTVTDGTRSLTAAIPAGITSASFTAGFNGLTADGLVHTVTASFPGCGTSSTTYPAPAACGVCSLTATTTPGACNPATNFYLATTVVRLTNPPAGVLTVTNGTQSLTTIIPSGLGSYTYTAGFNALLSDGAVHTVTASLPGCSNTTSTYTAPASCSVAGVCSVSIVPTIGACNPATNTYSTTLVVSVFNPTSGATLTITDGTVSQPFTTTAAGQNTFMAVFNGFPSNGSTHTVTASLPGCNTATTSYVAPAACSVAGTCSVSAVATHSVCNTATNTFSSTVVATVLNPTTGTITISDGALSQTFATTAVSSNTFTAIFNSLPSNGTTHTVTASLPGCSTATTTYAAPASCQVTPACLVGTPAVTTGICSATSNTYSTTAVVTIQNPTSGGTLTISNGVTNQPFATTAGSNNTFTMVFNGLVSDGATHTITASLPGCGSATAQYSAPASCSVAPVCSITPVVTAGACASTTNAYSATAVVRLSNPPAGVLTVTNGASSLTTTIASGLGSFTFTATFNGLTSDGATHTVTASLPGCSSQSVTYSAPASCSVAPVCSVSAVTSPGLCASATNTFSNTVAVTLTNPTAGILTVTDGPASLTFAVPTVLGTVTVSATFNGLASNGAAHTVDVSLPGCSSTTVGYTAPGSCSTGTPLTCAISPVVTVGTCASATNAYSATAVVRLTNPPAGVLTVTNGAQSLTTTIASGLSSFTFTGVFNGLTSDGATHTMTASLPGCTAQTVTYTAPASCSSTTGCPAFTLSPSPLPIAYAGGAYSQTLVASGGTGPYSFSASPTSLPPGLTLSTAGVLSGTASATGSFSMLVSVTDSKACRQDINPGTLEVTCLCLGRTTTSYAQAGTFFTTVPLASTNIVSGSLPPGLTFSPTGTLSGTPTTPGTFTFSLPVGPYPVCPCTSTFIIIVSSNSACSISPVVTAGACASATNTYSATALVTLTNPPAGVLTVTNGAQSLTTTIASGLSSFTFTGVFNGLTSDGATGTVTASLSGCTTQTVTYTAAASCSSTTGCPAFTLSPGSLPDGTVGTPYNATVVASGGTGPYSFSVSSGSLPAGLALSPTGIISGIPSTTGSFGISVRVSDNAGCFHDLDPGILAVVASTTGTGCQLSVMTASATSPTCNTATQTPNANGQLLVIATGADRVAFSLGSTFTGTYASAQSYAGLATSGSNRVLTNTLASPVSLQTYTIRFYGADPSCFTDRAITLLPTNCNCPPAKCVPLLVQRIR